MSTGCFKVWNGRVEEDRAAWMRFWEAWPGREVQAHPSYVRLFCADEAERPLCASWHSPAGSVLYPFVARDVSALPWSGSEAGPLVDLTTPYGYGGPYAWNVTDRERLTDSFWEAFDLWARAEGIVSEFVRFSLFEGTLLGFPGQAQHNQWNVVCDLTPALETIWAGFEHKVRKNVNKAGRSGIRVDFDPAGSRLDDFVRLYLATMKRRGATGWFCFSPRFFETLRSELAGRFCLAHALRGDELLSSELVLTSAATVYSFLAGADDRFLDLRPNDLLKYEIIRWARENGHSSFVLGGGFEPGDDIFRYKRAFAPKGLVPFRVGSRIHRPELYRRLNELRARNESLEGHAWTPRPGFFPEYRG